jgi:hypothetical protein
MNWSTKIEFLVDQKQNKKTDSRAPKMCKSASKEVTKVRKHKP